MRHVTVYIYMKGVTYADLVATTQNTKLYNGTLSPLQLNEKNETFFFKLD